MNKELIYAFTKYLCQTKYLFVEIGKILNGVIIRQSKNINSILVCPTYYTTAQGIQRNSIINKINYISS